MRRDTKRKAGNFFKILFVCILALSIPVLLFLYAVQAEKYTSLVREVTELEAKQEKLIEENKRLISDISILSSAERIEKIATEELKMHKAESDDIIRVEMTKEKK
ncbi:MAG: cell division protein FtsL [Treponema sp.]|nr:cell division protein FtsL [Treponema sp.]